VFENIFFHRVGYSFGCICGVSAVRQVLADSARFAASSVNASAGRKN